jgi:hypothetical protein
MSADVSVFEFPRLRGSFNHSAAQLDAAVQAGVVFLQQYAMIVVF